MIRKGFEKMVSYPSKVSTSGESIENGFEGYERPLKQSCEASTEDCKGRLRLWRPCRPRCL